MASFADKFNDPRWAEKRAAVLQCAGYSCEDCGADQQLEVHICYWVKGRQPWELPDDAYKCYCTVHREMRQRVEYEIRVQLAAFSIDDLDSWQLAVKELAVIPSGPRGPSVERMYVTAKRVRDDYDRTQIETSNEGVD